MCHLCQSFVFLILLFQLKQFKDQESNSDLFREETESQQRAVAAQDTQRRQVHVVCSRHMTPAPHLNFVGCSWSTSRGSA